MAGRNLLADETPTSGGRNLLSDMPAPPPPAPQPERQPAGGPSPRARRAVEEAKTTWEALTNRPIQGATMGFFAPEAAYLFGRGLQLIPNPAVKAAGTILTEAAPRIPRLSSAALGGAAGAAGTAAEQSALRAGASPEVAGLAGTTGELVTGIGLPSVVSRIPRMTSAVTRTEDAAKRAVTEAETLATRLERDVEGRLTETIQQTQARAAAAEKRLAEIDVALQQIATRDAVAQARAENRALDPIQVQELRRRVTRRLQDDVAAATAEARQAGKSVEAARAEALERVIAAETQKEELKSAANALAESLLSRPQTDAVQFGGQVRRVAQAAEEKFEAMREQQAKFGDAVASAERFLRVDTRNIVAGIDDVLRDVRDPSVRNPLLEIQKSLMTVARDDRQIPALNIAAADSLRKRLNAILSSRRITYENNQEGSAAAALHHLGNVRQQLMDAAGEAHPAYKNAVETWRRISEIPEFRAMQRGGELRRSLTMDPVTGNTLINEAEVVGQLLKASRGSGSTVVEDLIARDPELVNAARLFFNRELFGSGRVPSVDQLGAFLRTNERPLRSFGLYDEFSNIRSARRSAQTAMENAEAAVRQARASMRDIEVSEMRAAPSRSLISLAKGRQAEAVRGLETVEDIAKASSQRASEAERRLTAERRRIATEPEAARKLQNDLRTAQIDIERAAPGETVAAVRPAIDRLRRTGLVSDADYGRLVTEMQSVDDAFKASAKAAKDAEDARKAAQAVMQRWRDRVFGAAGAAVGFAGAGLLGLGPARFRRMFKE